MPDEVVDCFIGGRHLVQKTVLQALQMRQEKLCLEQIVGSLIVVPFVKRGRLDYSRHHPARYRLRFGLQAISGCGDGDATIVVPGVLQFP